MADKSILDWCDPEFSHSWRHVEEARPLFTGFIDAMALVERFADGALRLALEGPGFADLFGEDYASEVQDFLLLADRQDRPELLSACKAARSSQGSIQVDIAWSKGAGVHADDDENFFKTVVSIERVGRTEAAADILYFLFKDVSARRDAEHRTARSQFSSALRALFDEIFLLNLDTGSSEPVYAGGRSLVKEDGAPIETGFHTMFKTVHRDDIKLFWKYSNYTYVETQLFGPDPADAITFDMRRCGQDGSYHWERVFISRVTSGDKHKNVLVCSQNIDEQKDAQRRERELLSKAQTDALTGIFNRGTCEELIRAKLQGLSDDESAIFSIIDVDDFKRVNDTYGHSTGDKLLQMVAAAMRGACREGDIVGRMGGDEFVMLLSGKSFPDKETLSARMERCKSHVREGSAELGIEPPVTLSIGIVEAQVGDNAYNEVFNRADALLYEAKRSGKDALRFG